VGVVNHIGRGLPHSIGPKRAEAFYPRDQFLLVAVELEGRSLAHEMFETCLI